MPNSELRDHAFLAGFEEEHLETLEACVAGRSLWKPGKSILLRGDPADMCHLIINGTVAIEIRAPGTPPQTFQTLHGGDVLGWSWMFEPRLWTFDARAVAETSAVTLDATLLSRAIEDDPVFGLRFGTRMTRAIVNRLKATRLQVLDVYNH
ncbi:MAG: cyclic nucleotide-binding domain-containing protein [Acidimicrobiia bacterium]|jgi:CRP-like cAMP-binding protein